MTHRITLLVGLLLLCTVAAAEEWTSPDGAVSVLIPNLERFDEQPESEEFVKHWLSKDQTVLLAIVAARWPFNRPVPLDVVEQVFLEEYGGELTSSTSKRIDGHDTLATTVRIEESGRDLYVTQLVLQAGQHIYKFMTISSVPDESAARRFLDSVKVLRPSSEVTKASRHAAGQLNKTLPKGSPGKLVK